MSSDLLDRPLTTMFTNVNNAVGLSFFITEIPYEVFTYNELDLDPIRFEEKSKDVYPYMVMFLYS